MSDAAAPPRLKPLIAAPQNQLGQVMGAKGAKTRQRLLDATAELLATTPLRDLRVIQIVRQAKTSAATFYVYFNDVSEAVLALIGELTQSPPSLLSLIAGDWDDAEGYGRAHAFVNAYIDNYQANASLFRVRNLTSDEGDERFREARLNAVSPLIMALSDRIELRRDAGLLPSDMHPGSAAGALLAMIERIATIAPRGVPQRGVGRKHLIEASVYYATLLLGGVRPKEMRTAALRVVEDRADQVEAPSRAPYVGAAAGRVNQQGQAMGEKGVRTRKRLLDATETLLRTRSLLELSVADIAKTAETSPATFYLYFSDVSAAVLGVISQYTQSTPALMSLAASVGRGGEDADLRAQEFVQAYIAHWRAHGPLFRVRNLAADEGDERFVLVRASAVRPLLQLIAQMVRRNQTQDGPTGHLDPLAAGAVLLSMIDRLAVTPNYDRRDGAAGATTVQSVGRAASYYFSVLVGAPVGGRK